MSNPFALGYRSQYHEINLDRLAVRGTMPAWLAGTLVRNGPAQFEVGDRGLRHLFDGMAMLHAFNFHDGQVSYANRFLQSKAYRAAKETGRIAYSEFATDPCRSIFARLKSLFSLSFTDNSNVNVAMLANRYVAMTETPMAVEFDVKTLSTLGAFNFLDSLPGQLTTAHPHFDVARSEALNYITRFSFRSAYQIYSVSRGQLARRLIASVPVKEPGYMHSFAVTENYVVLVEFPLVVKPWQLVLSGKPFIENYRWKPERGSRFIVIDRRDGELRGVYETAAFFAFHHVNAFERDSEIVLDIATYDDAAVIDRFFLDRLRNVRQDIPTARLRRYRIELSGGARDYEVLGDESLELPRINYQRVNMKDYAFVYGISTRKGDGTDAANQLVRIDVRSGTALKWTEEGSYPGEPVFVAGPLGTAEEDGVILSVVLDPNREMSYLLVLDAASFQEIARAEVPQHIPFGFHGQFFTQKSR